MRQIKILEKQLSNYKDKETNMVPKEYEQMVIEHSKANMLKRRLQDIDKQASQITNEIRTTFSRNLVATRETSIATINSPPDEKPDYNQIESLTEENHKLQIDHANKNEQIEKLHVELSSKKKLISSLGFKAKKIAGALRTHGCWSEHKSICGRIYYYNYELNQNLWQKPDEWEDSEAQIPPITEKPQKSLFSQKPKEKQLRILHAQKEHAQVQKQHSEILTATINSPQDEKTDFNQIEFLTKDNHKLKIDNANKNEQIEKMHIELSSTKKLISSLVFKSVDRQLKLMNEVESESLNGLLEFELTESDCEYLLNMKNEKGDTFLHRVIRISRANGCKAGA